MYNLIQLILVVSDFSFFNVEINFLSVDWLFEEIINQARG